MNTRFNYMYRDAGNYKTFFGVVFEGEISDSMRQRFLDACSDEMFIPRALGLKGGVFPEDADYDFKFDHYWCEHDFDDSFELVNDAPSVYESNGRYGLININDFIAAFEKCSKNWETALYNPINLLTFHSDDVLSEPTKKPSLNSAIDTAKKSKDDQAKQGHGVVERDR